MKPKPQDPAQQHAYQLVRTPLSVAMVCARCGARMVDARPLCKTNKGNYIPEYRRD